MERVLQPQYVEKEAIASFHFPKAEVLLGTEQIGKRRANLEYALELGNSAYYKVKIVFEDEEGPKKVATTVWKLTKDNVILKNGIMIPVNRVHEVTFR